MYHYLENNNVIVQHNRFKFINNSNNSSNNSNNSNNSGLDNNNGGS